MGSEAPIEIAGGRNAAGCNSRDHSKLEGMGVVNDDLMFDVWLVSESILSYDSYRSGIFFSGITGIITNTRKGVEQWETSGITSLTL